MGGEHGAAVGGAALDDRPEEALGGRVHARRRLIEQDELRGSHQRDPDAELALVAARVLPGRPIRKLGQVEILDETLHFGLDCMRGHLLDPRVHAEGLATGHEPLERVVLRAVAHLRAYLLLLRQDGHAVEERVARRGRCGARQHGKRGALACAVHTEEAEALPGLDAKAQVPHRHLAAVTLVDFAQVAEHEVPRAVTAIDGRPLLHD
mmetsp:Transcript_63950/g.142860  ORF Transcript_63950/g.142860 Transcript_63950/m.142860 type:complete len:208 (-) Transcript_63950:1043-1666(-)